jgi:glycosyl transferase, family 25
MTAILGMSGPPDSMPPQLTKLSYSRAMRPIRVISLARAAERRAAFLRRNAHVKTAFFDAVDGRTLSTAQIAASGAFTPELMAQGTYGAHDYGAALSHYQLWKDAAVGADPITIAEDDALLRHDFEVRSTGVLATLPPGWDIVLWGWNFDSVLHVHPMGGVSPAVMLFDQNQLRASLDVFQALQTPVQAFRLEKAFGLMAYTLSPSGAARLLKLCFPQRTLSVAIPTTNNFVRNVGIDVAPNAIYREIQAFACCPPLAASPNVRSGA